MTGTTVFGGALTERQWIEQTILEMEYLSNITKFIGESPNNIIQRQTVLNAKSGNRITFDLMKKFTGEPVIDEAELAGNEEKGGFATDDVYIQEMAIAAKKYGKFEDIKSKKNLLTLLKTSLALRMREIYDNAIIDILSGNTAASLHDGTYSAWTSTAPTTNRKLYGGDWAGGDAIDTGDDWIRVRDISRFKTHARVTCGMRPVIVDGVETYVFITHPYVWNRIRAFDPDYENAVLYASERGKDNPLFSGISGYWDGVAIYENDHMYWNPTYSTAVRSLFLGAQAGIMAWGDGPYAGEQDMDYQRKLGISISMLWGFAKSVLGPDDFQGASTYTDDYGVIACDGYAAVTAGLASDTES